MWFILFCKKSPLYIIRITTSINVKSIVINQDPVTGIRAFLPPLTTKNTNKQKVCIYIYIKQWFSGSTWLIPWEKDDKQVDPHDCTSLLLVMKAMSRLKRRVGKMEQSLIVLVKFKKTETKEYIVKKWASLSLHTNSSLGRL